MKKKASIVIPIFNEEKGIVNFLDNQLFPALEKLSLETEVILVDDGSSDRTLERVRKTKIFLKSSTKLVAFSRNFGKELALSAGMHEATGDAVVLIDADGQHPVSAIFQMIEKWREGAQVVTAVSSDKQTRHRLGSKLFSILMKGLGNKNYNPRAMDFRLVNRVVVDEFNKLTERTRLTRGLIDWLGFKQEYIEVKISRRGAGKASYSRKKLAALAVDALASSSRTPLLIFGYIGAFITLCSGALGLFILVQQYILGDPLGLEWAGAVAMSVFVAFLVGLVLISQAITALYVSQIQIEAKNRPLYVIDPKKSKGLR